VSSGIISPPEASCCDKNIRAIPEGTCFTVEPHENATLYIVYGMALEQLWEADKQRVFRYSTRA
jgi:hypothetical protein